MLISLSSCAITSLKPEEDAIVQIYIETPSCKKIGSVIEWDRLSGNYDVVKKWIKKSVYASGGNAFMVDYVSPRQIRETTAFINVKRLKNSDGFLPPSNGGGEA